MGESKLRAYLDPTCSEELVHLFEGSDRWELVHPAEIGAASAPAKEQLSNAAELKRLLITCEKRFLDETEYPVRDCPVGVLVFEAVPEKLQPLESFLDDVFVKYEYYYKTLKVHVMEAGFRASSVPREGKPRTEFRKW